VQIFPACGCKKTLQVRNIFDEVDDGVIVTDGPNATKLEELVISLESFCSIP
jgi:hypothetical protein